MPLSKSVTSRSTRGVTFELPSGDQPISGGHNPLSRRRGQPSSSSGNGGLGERDYQGDSSSNISGASVYSSGMSMDRGFMSSASPSPASIGIFGRTSSMTTPTPITSPNTNTGRGLPFPSLPTGQFDQHQPPSSLVATSVPTFGEVNFSFGQAASSSSLKPPLSTPRGTSSSSGGHQDVSAAPRPRSAGIMGRFSAVSAFQAMANFVGAVKTEESSRAMVAQGPKVSAAATTEQTSSNTISSWSLSTNKMDLLRATERGGHPHLFDGDGKLTTGMEVSRTGHVHSVGRPHLGIQGDEASLRGRGSHRHGMSQEWLQRTVHVTGAPPGEHEEIVDTLTRLCGQVAHHRTLRFRVAHTNRSSIMAAATDSWESAIPTRSTPDIPTPLRITFSKAASAEKAIALDLGGVGVITTSSGRRIAIVAGDDVSSSTAGSHPTVGSQHMFLQDEEDQYYGEGPNSSNTTALVVSMNHSHSNNTNNSRNHMLSTSFAPRGGRRVEVSGPLGLSMASGPRSVATTTPQEGPGDLNTIFMQERRSLEEQSKKRIIGAKSGRVDQSGVVGGGLAAVVGMRRVKYPSLMALPFAEYWLLPLISE